MAYAQDRFPQKKIAFKLFLNFIPQSDTMAGGTRILVELSKRWLSKGYPVTFYTSKEGEVMLKNYLPGRPDIISTGFPSWLSRVASKSAITEVIFGLFQTFSGLTQALKSKETKPTVILSATPFLPDIIPTFFLRRKLRAACWIVPMSMFSPNPLRGGFSEEAKKAVSLPRTSDLAFYLNERLLYGFIKRYSDGVNVTNELDKQRCVQDGFAPNNVLVIKGGVDSKVAQLFPEPPYKKYDAIFIGRLYPQKGVLELVDIWQLVCAKQKNARLAIIGNGLLEKQVKKKIERQNLQCNIDLYGFLDGVDKTKVIKNSRVVLHPAIYDSGGMAACEAMICGLPGVSFDLPALRCYYPKGMLKTKCYNLEEFCENILKLLNDPVLYSLVKRDAYEYAKGWDWDDKADELLLYFNGRLNEKKSN